MSEIITVNLSSPESSPRILLLLQQFQHITQFNPGIAYNIIDNQQTITLNLNHILLPFRKPAALREQHKQSSEAAYYAVIEESVLGRGNFGSVRTVIGTWKVEHGEAVLKVKPDENKTRLLKTLFFEPKITETMHNEQPNQLITLEMYKLFSKRIRKKLNKELTHEQIVGSYTPHLSTKYPVIETAEGVHLLMRKQPGQNLETVISFLQKNPAEMSVIQRLLLCLALYESLDREVHAIASTTTGGLIHRDIKPANTMFSINDTVFELHIIDYGMCTDDSQQTAQLCGSPRYIDPQVFHANALPSAANDLFAVAIICTEIWGDTHRKTINNELFVYENQNIQFTGLFDKIECSVKLTEQLRTLFTATTRVNPLERLAKEQVIKEYTTMLLTAFAHISSNIPELNKRIDVLRAQLKDYYSLSSAERIELNKEFVAADYLTQNPQAFTQPAPPDKPLYTQWNAYYLNLIKQITTVQLPVNSPVMLLNHSANIQKYLTRLLIPLTPQSVKQLSNIWSALIELSRLFQRTLFLMPQIKHINMIFEQELGHIYFNQTMTANIKQKMLQQLTHYLRGRLPHEIINDNRLDDLCHATVTVDGMSDCTLRDEWTILLRLLSLYALLVQLNYVDSLALITAFAPENTLAAAYDALYDSYQQHIKNQLTQAIDNEDVLVSRSPFFFASDASSLPVHRLQTDIKHIFEENKNQPQEIQSKIYNTTVCTMCALRTSAATKGHSTAQKKVIDSLSLFEENLLGSTMKLSLFANSTLARL